MVTPCTAQTPWRETGDTTPEAFIAEFAGSPVAVEADALYDTASPYQRLYAAHSKAENRHDTVGILITPDMRNNLALRPRGYPEETGQRNGFATFASYQGCLAAWRRRLVDPALGYANAVTMLEYSTVYNPAGDAHPITGVPNDPARYCDRLLATINRLPLLEEEPMPDLVFGRVPHPPHDRLLVTKAGPGHGYWQLPKPREIVGTCVHCTYGYGSAEWYRDFFSVGGERADDALVDYYVDRRGRIALFNEPRGLRSPWANGDANGLEGDGPAFVANLGVGAVNDRLVSIETEGRGEPMTPPQLAALAALVAHWHDQAGVPWDQFPFNLATNCVTQMQHWEFSSAHVQGRGCPFAGVQAQTDAYQEAARAIMRQHQTAPDYAPLDPPGLAAWDGTDRTLGAVPLWACRRTFTATKPTPAYRYADRASGEVRAPYPAGAPIAADYWLENGGEAWALLADGARVPLKDAKPRVRFSTS